MPISIDSGSWIKISPGTVNQLPPPGTITEHVGSELKVALQRCSSSVVSKKTRHPIFLTGHSAYYPMYLTFLKNELSLLIRNR